MYSQICTQLGRNTGSLGTTFETGILCGDRVMELSPYTVKYMLTLRISVKIELLDTQVLGHPVGQRI